MEFNPPPLHLSKRAWLTAHHLQKIRLHHLMKWHHLGWDLQSMFAPPYQPWRAPIPMPTDAITQKVDTDLDWATQQNHHILTFDDLRYPGLLKHIPSPPMVLYIKGQTKHLNTPQCCIVGSRNATSSGLKDAFNLAHYLSLQGFCITSGLALGIDGQAHLGALNAKSATIAVLGCGLGKIYPKRHQNLAKAILENGCLVTEYPIHTPIRRHQFPERNHIMSGLSLGTIIVEARAKSGSLISAYASVDQGREVMVRPPQNNEAYTGNKQLMNEGATVIQSYHEVPSLLEAPKENLAMLLNEQLEKRILYHIHEKPRGLEDLQTLTHTSSERLSAALQRLIHHQVIKQDGMLYGVACLASASGLIPPPAAPSG